MSRPAQSRAFLVGLGLLLAFIGGAFCFWLGRSYFRVKAVDAWPEVRCVILRSEVEEFLPVPNVAPRYRVKIDYYYEYNGRSWHSGRVRSRERATALKGRAEEWQAKYPTGRETVCFVNPADPSFAILEKDSKAVIYTIWFPGLFVVGGLGMAVQALRKKSRPRGPTARRAE
jgi:hypothetical protein